MTVAHWERSPLYQINFALDMAEKGVGLDTSKMLYTVKTVEVEDGDKLWLATCKDGCTFLATTLSCLKENMIQHEKEQDNARK